MTDTTIEITDERDLAILRISQGSAMRRTVLPSGLTTPDRPMIVRGDALVEPTPEDRRRLRLDE